MSSYAATAHDARSLRTAMFAVIASVIAIALAVSLPMALRTTKTVVVHDNVTTSTSVPTTYGPSVLRSAHGG